MATVFISHSSQDDALTGDLLLWLHDNGFRDTFVDHVDILGGENWTDRLRDQAASCRVVICLISLNWLKSSECFNEFQAAWYMGKSILPLFLVDMADPGDAEATRRLSRVLAETQGIDLRGAITAERRLDMAQDSKTADLIARSLRAVGAHSDIGLDPTAFAIDPIARPTPFPGLVSFGDTEADAAIFYGRSREIAEAIEELRSMRANADRRPLVILGVSGAGKSSVLKAGILPRLRRESQAWLPLRIFRPGIDPLSSFADALARTLADLGDREPPGQIRSALDSALAREPEQGADPSDTPVSSPVTEVLDTLADRLRAAAGAPNATILISVDQAEELLRADSRAAMQLSACLAAALAGRRGWLIAFTIRTDRFPDLQSHPSFRDIKARGYDLRQLPPFRFSDVIEGPAARYGVTLAPELVDAFMDDAPERDALPLLAFALQRLWEQFSLSKMLRLEDYTALGGMSGLISDAAERALAGLAPGDGQTATPSEAQLQERARLAERCFVPALVDVNESRSATRRTANWTEFSAEEKNLLRQFEAWRLVVRRGVGHDATVEVAHEALFREWTRMRAWLEPEIHRIEVLRGVEDAARQWDSAGRKPVLLNHRGQRLVDARALLSHGRYGERLGPVDRAYLSGCATLRRRSTLTFATVATLALAAICLGVWSYLQSERRMIAEREATFAARVENATGVGDISTLESFTHYVLSDPYARTREDRFDVLRSVLAGAQTAIYPEYAIAEYALDAVDVPEDAVFELEYSAERVMYADLFPVLWRPYAVALTREWGLPAPTHFRLVENPDFPPGRVVIRRSGKVVYDVVLPATDRRHMLDRNALDREDLRQFFETNQASFTPADHIAPGLSYYYVPDWSVPIWNAGRDRNADSRVIPPGADFALALRNLILSQPQIVMDALAMNHLLQQIPPDFGITVAEYREIRGSRVLPDLLGWLQAGNSLGDIPFALGGMASLGEEVDVSAMLEDLASAREPVLHGAVLSPEALATRQQGGGGDATGGAEPRKGDGSKRPGPPTKSLPVVITGPEADARREALDVSFAHLDLRTEPVRILVPAPPANTDRDTWSPIARAIYADASLALTPAFLSAQEDMRARMFRSTGVLTLKIGVRPIPGLADGQIVLDVVGVPERIPVAVGEMDTGAILDSMFSAIEDQVLAASATYVFPHMIPAYLEAASDARRSWAQTTFAHTDLMQLVAGLIRHESSRPGERASDGTETSVLLHFDWLLGALVFSAAISDAADGAAHLALWRELSARVGAAAPETTTSGGDDDGPEVSARVADGIAHLADDEVAEATTAFTDAAAQDPYAARAAFLALYPAAAPQLLFSRIRAECERPTNPGLGVIEAQQLEFLLAAFGPDRSDAIAEDERTRFELCLLGARDLSDADAWLDAAVTFAANLRSADQLTPEESLWLGRTIWALYDPLDGSQAKLAVGRRFLISALERVEAADDLVTIAWDLSDDCYRRLDRRPCMRRTTELAEVIGKPEVALYATEILAESPYEEDRARAREILDLFEAMHGRLPTFSGEEFAESYRAYIQFVRGHLHYADGHPGSDRWRQAKQDLTAAMENEAFRFSVLPALSKVITYLDGVDAAEDLTTKALFDASLSDVDPTDFANLYFLRFRLAVDAGHAEEFLHDLVDLPATTGCLGDYGPDCQAAWLWRAAGQVIFRHADWQTVARTVTSKVDHPYSTLIALILNAQGGEAAGSAELLRRNWSRVDPDDWEGRIGFEDEGVWREILLGYAVGESIDGYGHEEILEMLQDPAAFQQHPLSRIGLYREEMLSEALFYTAMLEIAQGRLDEGIALLKRTRDIGYWLALEYSLALPILNQLEGREAE